MKPPYSPACASPHQRARAASPWLVCSKEERARRALITTLQGLGEVVRHLLGPAGVEEYLRRVILVIATGNGDAHLKNWSFVYPDRKRPTWSPLYDQVTTVVWGDDTLALPLYDADTFRKVQREHLTRLGGACGLTGKRAGELIDETLEALRTNWEGGRLYPPDHANRLRALWRKSPLTKSLPELERP